MRPANIVTAVADILAGVAISGFFTTENFSYSHIVLAVLSTSGLYGGGVVFNDVFDADLDRVERPERPIPSGVVTEMEGTVLGGILLLTGVFAAFLLNSVSGLIAIAIAVAALVYDRYGKHHLFLGPLNMGLCRGLNLLLGISILPDVLKEFWLAGIVPVIYIASITMISRGEVHGSKSAPLRFAAFLYFLVVSAILAVAWHRGEFLMGILFVLPWAAMIFVPLSRAIQLPTDGPRIGKAVKAGVIALILMDAAWAASFGMIFPALFIVLLLPVSLFLARAFAVT